MGRAEDQKGVGGRRTSAGGQVRRYAAAAGVVGLAFALELGLPEIFGPPCILFYPAVALAAMAGGLGPGLLATALAAVLALRWVLPAEAPGGALGTREVVSLLTFSAMGVLLSAAAERHRRARDELAQAGFQRALHDSDSASLEAFRRAAAEARLSAERQAFAVTLSDALRSLADPAEIQRQASRLLGEHLGASRVHYAEVVEEGRVGLVRSDYTDGLPSVAGRHRFDDYGQAVMDEFRAGRTLVVPDVASDPRLTPRERAATAALRVGSYVIVPLFKGGRPVAVLVVHQSTARAWAPLELELMADTAERTWAAVERAHAEAALRENEARFRAIFEQAAVGVALVESATGRFLQVNARLAALLGYAREELEALTWADVTDPEDLPSNQASVGQMLASGAPFHVEKRYLRKDGGRLWASLTVSPVSVPGVPVTRQISVVTDITERKQAEEALRRSEEGLRAAQSVAHVGSWTWHVKTGRLAWSDEMYRIFGIDASSFTGDLGDVVARAIHPDDRAAVHASNEGVLRLGRPTPLEYRILHPDGAVRTVWAEAGALQRDEEGRPDVLTGIVLDVTERRAAERERGRLEAQLQEARKLESIGRLAGGIAHDFNNMLGVILGHAELALEQAGVEGALRDDLEEIHAAARRSADLTRQLLAFARRQTISPHVLDLNATVAGMLKMLQRLLGEQVGVAWRPGAGLWPVRLDPSQVDQVLANLCVNARDAIAGAGRLTIETANVSLDEAACRTLAEATPGDWVRLTVSDDGCGMDQETLARVFEPFFTTKAHGKGTGLGLATTYGIVKQNGGFIGVSSEPGVGTAFAIHLPRHQGAAVLPSAGGALQAARGHETVLLVEDERSILQVARRMLEGQGYRVLAASSPAEGLRLAAEHPGQVDLLLTDVVMPELNGQEVARILQERHPRARRLFMSGYTADVIARQGVLAEGVHFIQKPFTAESLAAAVRSALDAGR
ncbi:MAG: PAS domain S-box protein [Anaeromyxobacteraceae bacterium]|nr:PAS domain S-box protein [Anaeromyxobacteraceae bacterium]